MSSRSDFVTAVTLSVFVVVVSDEASLLTSCCDTHWVTLLQLHAVSSNAA